MPKTDTLNLVATLSNGMADPSTSERYYDDVLVELAREGWFADARLLPLTIGQQGVSLGTDVVDTLALIYDDCELDEIPLTTIESIDPQWRDAQGYTRSYVTQDVTKKSVELHPAVSVASNPNLGSSGVPLGADYPTYNALLFYSYAPLDPLQPQYYLELIIALRVLALEFARESDHTDMEFSQAAQALGDLCKGMLE